LQEVGRLRFGLVLDERDVAADRDDLELMNRVSPFRPSAALFPPGSNYDALGLERLKLVEL
jgi:hypothetical protein